MAANTESDYRLLSQLCGTSSNTSAEGALRKAMNRRLREILLAIVICIAASCAFGINLFAGHSSRQHVEQVEVEEFSASLPNSWRRLASGILALNPATVRSINRAL